MDRQAVMVRNALGAIRKGGLAKIGIFGALPLVGPALSECRSPPSDVQKKIKNYEKLGICRKILV